MHLFMALSLFLASVPAAQPVERLSIESTRGERVFHVEVVKEEKDRNRGLMYRRRMDADHGMLFDYDPPQQIAFWMKNTYIPLDIIFIGADGRIITIAANAKPFDLTPIPSNGVIRGVLEINGGLAAKLGINVGDRVRHALFDAR
jgi:uncharacterized membrane protein (UPF0127 family)